MTVPVSLWPAEFRAGTGKSKQDVFKKNIHLWIGTSYDGSSIAGGQITFDEYTEGNGEREKPKAICVEIEEVTDLDGDGAVGIEDVKLFLERNPHSHRPLEGGGDFQSEECIELLKEADIVVTNPPFSLFKEFLALLTKNEKKFLVIGNTNAITYLEVFPLIKANSLWLGCTNFNVGMFFEIPDEWKKYHHINELEFRAKELLSEASIPTPFP